MLQTCVAAVTVGADNGLCYAWDGLPTGVWQLTAFAAQQCHQRLQHSEDNSINGQQPDSCNGMTTALFTGNSRLLVLSAAFGSRAAPF